MPRKSTAAVAEKPASQRKTRAKAAPAPESTPAPTAMEQGDFVRGKNDPSLHGFVASVGRTWLKLQGDKNCKIDEVELVCRLPEQLRDHFKLVGLSREEKLDNLLEPYGFYNLSNWRVAKSDDDSTHFRFLRNKQWEIQFFRNTEVDLLSDGHTWYLALDKRPELKSNGDIEKYCVEAIDHAESIIAQVKEYEDAALAALIEPAKFQVGDRVFYVQETNTGIVQDLREGEALIKLSLAASKPLWLGLGQLHPYTVNHVVDVTTLVKGELIKGQTLQGDEHSGKFTNLSASGMAMIEVDGKKRMLSPYTLVRIVEEPSEVTPAEKVAESQDGDRPYPDPEDQELGDGEIEKEEFTVTLANGWEVKVEVEDWDWGEEGGDYGFSFSGPVSPTGYRHEFSKKVEDIRQHAQELAQKLFDKELPKDVDGNPIFDGDTCIVLKGKNKGFEGEINGNVFEGKMSFKPDYKVSTTPSNLRRLKQGATSIKAIGDLSAQEKTEGSIDAPAAIVQPNAGDRMDGLSLTGNYHSGVFVERTTSGLFLIKKEDGKEVIITPDSARILEQLALPAEPEQTSEPEQPAEFPSELPLSQIRIDKGLQPRGGLDRDHVQDLTEALQRGESLPAVGIMFDGESHWLYSGFHRTEAHRMADRVSISVKIESGDYRAAKIAAAATNADHGLKRSPETKRRVVTWFLSDPEWSQWSDRQIAEATKTSHVFVGKMRRELAESGELPPNVVAFPDTRKFNRDGKTHEMAIAPRPKDPIPTVEELYALFSQIGSVEPAVRGTGFAVQNAIGAPFPLAFKNKMQAWEWWQSHTEQIARLVSGAGDYKPPLEPTPQTEISEEVREGLAEAGLQICAPSITPAEFNAEMSKPLPAPKLPKGICNLTEISGGWRVDGLELAAEVYAKLAAIARQHTNEASLKEAIAFLVQSFELAEQPVDEEVEA